MDAVSGSALTDPDLLAAIRANLGLADGQTPTAGQLAGITSIDLSGRNVLDLSGIQQLTGLTSLTLPGNMVKDLSPLFPKPP